MFAVDRLVAFSTPRRQMAIFGWCCHDDLRPVVELWAQSAGTSVPCLSGLHRPDIAEALKSPELERSGFICRVPMPGVSAGVALIARDGESSIAVAEFSVDWASAETNPNPNHAYGKWLAREEPRLFWPELQVPRRLASLSAKPVFSIILPTFNTGLYHLQQCLDSVAAQHYPYWELCVTDDASSDPRVKSLLLERAASEPRIRLTFSEQRGGISRASNQSLASATGEFIALLDHDDELHPAALLEMARALNAGAGADLLYSDEDKIDQLGTRSQPAFKPAFDEDMLCAFDYLGHLIVIRTDVARQVGGFRSDSDGAQDWDLLLRVIRVIPRDRITHVPKPLYHWRMHEESTAYSLASKPYAVRAWNTVLARHLESVDHSRPDDGLFLGSMRVRRTMPAQTRAAVLYRACDGPHQRRALSRTRFAGEARFFELVLSSVHRVDDPGASPLMTWQELDSDVTVVVSCAIDTVNHHFLDELVAQAARADCGVVGATIVAGNGTVVTAGLAALRDGTQLNPYEGLALHEGGYMGQAKVVRRVPAIAAHAYAFRTQRLAELRGLATLGEDSLGEVCAMLVRTAHASGLGVLHTPYAVATLRAGTTHSRLAQSGTVPAGLVVNPNLETFADVPAVLRGSIL